MSSLTNQPNQGYSKHPLGDQEPVDRLPSLIQNLIERAYLGQMQQLAWQFNHTQVSRALETLRISKISEMTPETRDYPGLAILSGLSNAGVGLALILIGDRNGASLYLGTFPDKDRKISSDEAFSLLRNAMQVYLPGARLENHLEQEDYQETIINRFDAYEYCACITGLPDVTSNQEAGLETLIDGLRGENYMMMVIAEPANREGTDQLIRECRRLSSRIHSIARQTANQGYQSQTSYTHTAGQSFNNVDPLFGLLMNNFSPLQMLSDNTGMTETDASTEGESFSQGVSVEKLNKEYAFLETILDEYVDRLETGKRTGLWNTGVYLLTRSRSAVTLGQSFMMGIYTGEHAKGEPYRSFILERKKDSGPFIDLHWLLQQIMIPKILWADGTHNPLSPMLDQLSTLLTSGELARLYRPPQRQVQGLSFIPSTTFNINPPEIEQGMVLGNVVHIGEESEKTAQISIGDLTRHVFVTGVTGAGKTNTCLLLLKSAAEAGVPFMVIEPAKQEYTRLAWAAGLEPACRVYTLGDEAGSPLRLNPFQFIPGFPLLTHIDYLKAIFNASFPMYAPMPYILEEAILGAYQDWGWDVTTGKNKYANGDAVIYFTPTLKDVYEKIDPIVQEKGYHERLTMDISAALKARIKSLLVGGKGAMLNTRFSDSLQRLFSTPCVLQLRRIGNDEEKCFLIAMLLVWLYEQCEARQTAPGLQHLTLIEEAHRILRNVPIASSDNVGASYQAVSTFSNILAEIRAYGEGLVIVDQIPAKLSPDVVKNTDLKVLHRIVAADDRDFVGNAMNLSQEQKEHVARLRTGEAVVYYEAARTALLVKFHKAAWEDSRPAGEQPRETSTLRRMACYHCEHPCQFGAKLLPTSEVFAWSRYALAALLFAAPSAQESLWKRFVSSVYQKVKNSGSAQSEWFGQTYCLVAQASGAVLDEMVAFHPVEGNMEAKRMQCELAASRVTYHMMKNQFEQAREQINGLSSLLTDHIAVKPLKPEAGCKLCQNSCRFGYWVFQQKPERGQQVERSLRKTVPKLHGAARVAFIRELFNTHYQEPYEQRDALIHCALTQIPLTQKNLEPLGFFDSHNHPDPSPQGNTKS